MSGSGIKYYCSCYLLKIKIPFSSYQSIIFQLVIASVIGITVYLFLRKQLISSQKREEKLKMIIEAQTKQMQNEKIELLKSIKTIQEQNQEKDVLIQEVHHRVKNNLQAISSIVEMQIMSVKREQSRNVLTDTYRRIKAMSLVHERLHMTDNIAKISANEYLKTLIDSINATVNLAKLPIQFKPRICHLNLNVSDCISLGMITSEAISNSIKYAFKEVSTPIIYIDLFHQIDRSWLTFRISDNGAGIPDQFTTGNENSLGIRLIQIFSAQLKGQLTISNKKGTEITIIFKVRENENSNL